VKLWDQVAQAGFSAVTSGSATMLGHSSADEGDCAFCWVHSRKANGKTKVSTQCLIDNNSKLESYTSTDAYQKAVKTYGGENNVFLSPDSVADPAGGQDPNDEDDNDEPLS